MAPFCSPYKTGALEAVTASQLAASQLPSFIYGFRLYTQSPIQGVFQKSPSDIQTNCIPGSRGHFAW